MMSDQILAGVEQNEISALERISSGYLEVPEDVVAMLHAKGWIDLANGQMLLTLTGRTLLNQRPEVRTASAAH